MSNEMKDEKTKAFDSEATDIPQCLPDGTYEPVLTKKDLDRCGRRWCATAVHTFNYQNQLAPAVLYSTYYALRKIYRGDEEGFKKSLENQFRYYNCNPVVSGVLVGAALALEDKGHNDALAAVNDLKIGLMGPISGITDPIFGIMIPTILGSVASYMALEGNPVGFLIWCAFTIALFIWKVGNYNLGYRLGTSLVAGLADRIGLFTESVSVLGLTVVGALIPSVVKISTGASFSFGEIEMSLQAGVFDAILPSLLPVLATALVYWLVKKRVSMNLIIVGIIAISLAGAALGFLSV